MDNQDLEFEYEDQNMDFEEEYDDGNYYDYDQENYYAQNNDINKYDILPQSNVFSQLNDLAQKTSVMIALPYGWSLLLLREFKWNYEYATEYFQKPHFYQSKIGYSPDLLSPTAPEIQQQQFDACMICCAEGKMIKNICQDSFCIECWKGHVKESIDSMNPFPKCMGCSVPLLYEMVIKIIKESTLHNKYLDKYEKLLCQLFSTSNTAYQCCPGTDCTNCIKCESYEVTTVKCTCGKSFCFRCKNDDHSPCTCDERLKWIDMVLKEEADAKWMSLNTKICPWCNKAVERSAGCNYMACLCGKSFCYMCSKPWEPDHKDHFKCHIFKKKDNDNNKDKEKQILEKMNFFAEKYLNANRNANDLKKIDTFEKRKLLFETLNIDLTDSDFIDQAYRFAIECCESLKWIYVFCFFVKFKNDQKKEAIEFTQGVYECYKEQLLKKLSFDLKNFLSAIEKEKDEQVLNFADRTEQFLLLKKNITNYYTCTKQFKQKFVEELENIDCSLIKRFSEDQAERKEEVPDKMNRKKSTGLKKKGK